MSAPKGERLERVKRRALVERLYLEGHPPRRIQEVLAVSGHPYRVGTIRNDIVAIRKALRDDLEEMFGRDRGAGEWYWRNAIRDREVALKSGDLRTAYGILRDLAQISGGLEPLEFVTRVSMEDAQPLLERIGRILAEEITDPELLERVLRNIADREERT